MIMIRAPIETPGAAADRFLKGFGGLRTEIQFFLKDQRVGTQALKLFEIGVKKFHVEIGSPTQSRAGILPASADCKSALVIQPPVQKLDDRGSNVGAAVVLQEVTGVFE